MRGWKGTDGSPLGVSFLRGLFSLPSDLLRYAARGGFTRSRAPIFVVGCGHSGTTLLRAMLGRNPEVYGVGYESELFLLPSVATVRQAILLVERKPYRRFAEWQAAARAAGRPRWVEKTPQHVASLGWILRLSPNASVVMITRDPRDVVASMVERGRSLDDALAAWIRRNEHVVRWKDSPRCTLVKYEDLVADPRATLTAVCTFLGLRFDPAMLAPREDETVVPPGWERGSHDQALVRHMARRERQIRSPLYDGRGRWERDLTSGQVATVLAATESLRRILGYDDVG